jgi:hypothetical protein
MVYCYWYIIEVMQWLFQIKVEKGVSENTCKQSHSQIVQQRRCCTEGESRRKVVHCT